MRKEKFGSVFEAFVVYVGCVYSMHVNMQHAKPSNEWGMEKRDLVEIWCVSC